MYPGVNMKICILRYDTDFFYHLQTTRLLTFCFSSLLLKTFKYVNLYLIWIWAILLGKNLDKLYIDIYQ